MCWQPARSGSARIFSHARCGRKRRGGVPQRRARSMTGAKLVACADVDLNKAAALAQSVAGCSAFADWRELMARVDCDLVIVATLHDSLAEITEAAVKRGRHVLVEKPAGRR